MTQTLKIYFRSVPSIKIGLLSVSAMALSACSGSDVSSPDASVEERAQAETESPVVAVVEMSPDPDVDDNTEVRQADSHVHGAAALAMAVDGNEVVIELETPLYNLLGFEHAPETDAQMQAVDRAEAALSDPGSLFRFNPQAGCAPVPVAAVSLFDEGHEHDDAHDRDEHHHDEHNHDHDDDAHHDEDHHDHEDDHDHAHKDVLLSYTYICETVSNLDALDHELFARFDNLNGLDFVFLGPTGQISDSLSRGDDRINLAG